MQLIDDLSIFIGFILLDYFLSNIMAHNFNHILT